LGDDTVGGCFKGRVVDHVRKALPDPGTRFRPFRHRREAR
jgi:hypothetical protein